MKAKILLFSLILSVSVAKSQTIDAQFPGYEMKTLLQTELPMGMCFNADSNLVIVNRITPPTKLTVAVIDSGNYVKDSVLVDFANLTYQPQYIKADKAGNIFFLDANRDDGNFYRITPDLNIETIYFATTGEFNDPRGLSINSNNEVFVVNNIMANQDYLKYGYISEYKLNDTHNAFLNSHPYFISSFPNGVIDLEFSKSGDLYITTHSTLAKVKFDSLGYVSSLDMNFAKFPVDSSITNFICGIGIDNDDNVYVSEVSTNETTGGKIYEVDSLGNVELFASGLNAPRDIVFDSKNRMYVSDYGASKIYQIQKATTTGVKDGYALKSLRVFPNPTSNSFSVEVNNELNTTGKNLKINLYDMTGKKILNAPMQSSNTNIDISNFKNGIYLYRITDGEEIMAQGKMIKK
ncbi:T9SS type A sorting domain-containing protein [Prolixibacter bellariivorans]|nr:T9SS type A sorting domain-containing protein [Prolixibacter bellariivorans]